MSKKTRSRRAKITLLRFGVISICALAATAWSLRAPSVESLWAQATSTEVPCGSGTGIVLGLSDDWQPVALQHQGVLCAFRNKNGGFPTLNIILEANPQPSITPGVMAREAAVRNAYHLVGLTDATFSESRLEPLGEQESFHTTVRYMNQNMPMEGLILQVQLPDRLYTASIVDREGHPILSKEALLATLRSIRIPGENGLGRSLSPRLPGLTALVVIGIIAASLLFFGLMTARRRR
jgi:hypothetical protein